VAEEMGTSVGSGRTPGFDLITGETLKNLTRKAFVKLTTLISACIRLNYIPDAWKTAEVILIPRPGKNFSEVEAYRPISLLPIMSKLFEKLILMRLKPIIADKHLVPTHQFGFRKNHSTIDQVHHITDIIEKPSKTKACALLSFLTLHKLSTEYGIEAFFINRGQLYPIISIYY
jgi:hypothetical protein